MLKKGIFGGIIIIGLLIAGFIFLLRGCLSGYDERSAITPALFFEKEGKSVVFTIIRYGKATSYKSNGGSTYKSLNTNYYIQSNDAVTGEKLDNKKIKHSSDIKFYPITVMGTGNGKAWVFIGELYAFDPLTLEQTADREMIEAKNPQLRGKMPEAKNYYEYDTETDEVLITATDGIKYRLQTSNLMAIPVSEEDNGSGPYDKKIKALKKEGERLNELYKSSFERYRAFNKLYSEQKISTPAYQDSTRNFRLAQDSITELRKKLNYESRDLDIIKNSGDDTKRKIADLSSGSKNYPSIITAVDTFNGRWYGLLSTADLEKPDSRFRYRSVYSETARNKLYTAAVSIEDSTRKIVELKVNEPVKLKDEVYLQGGFLLNRNTALPIHTNDGFIVCSRDKVGNEGKIILTVINLAGKTRWIYNTGLTNFADWIYTPNRLMVLGNDNKEISSSDANVLISIDMLTGRAVLHDYFKDSMRK